MPTVQANGIEIYYEEAGSGEPLLMVMGLGAQLIDWPQALVDQLVSAGFRVIRHDNRDIGLSQGFDWTPPTKPQAVRALATRKRPQVGYTVTDMADDAAGLLDALGIESAHVMGVSMGGMIVQSLAINHPHKVRSVCSIMSNTGDRKNGGTAAKVLAKLARAKEPPKEEAAVLGTEQYAMFAGSAWDSQAHLERAIVSVERAWRPGGVARQWAAILGSPDRTEGLGTVTAPVLVIHGLQDTLVLPSGGIATAKATPGSRLLMFPDMGHDLPTTRTAETVEAIRLNANRARVLAAV